MKLVIYFHIIQMLIIWGDFLHFPVQHLGAVLLCEFKFSPLPSFVGNTISNIIKCNGLHSSS
jgi:hypothetical protein